MPQNWSDIQAHASLIQYCNNDLGSLASPPCAGTGRASSSVHAQPPPRLTSSPYTHTGRSGTCLPGSGSSSSRSISTSYRTESRANNTPCRTAAGRPKPARLGEPFSTLQPLGSLTVSGNATVHRSGGLDWDAHPSSPAPSARHVEEGPVAVRSASVCLSCDPVAMIGNGWI